MISPALKRISSGINGLDAITAGGIPEHTSTMVYGPPKSGKSVFAYHFLAQSLKDGDACVIVTTDYRVDEHVRSMSGFNWSIENRLKSRSIQIVVMIPVASATAKGSVKSVPLANPIELMLSLRDSSTCLRSESEVSGNPGFIDPAFG